jgi:hypothetical protein
MASRESYLSSQCADQKRTNDEPRVQNASHRAEEHGPPLDALFRQHVGQASKYGSVNGKLPAGEETSDLKREEDRQRGC